ncbi:MAG: hypothetical protein N4A50_09310 [Vallitalea sp.]|jgi:hypothetical protein|nr:hypothetical protein [Vallitalea sp.]
MLNLIKGNFKYVFQYKYYLLTQIIFFSSVIVFTGIYSYKDNITGMNDIPIATFLFISTYLLVCVPLIGTKTFSSNSSYSILMLSFPVSKIEFVTSQFLTVILYMISNSIIIITTSIIAMLIGNTLNFSLLLPLLLIVLLYIGCMGCCYLLIYFCTKLYKPVIIILYFIGFILSTSSLNYSWIIKSDFCNILIGSAIFFMFFSYIISLIAIRRKEF